MQFQSFRSFWSVPVLPKAAAVGVQQSDHGIVLFSQGIFNWIMQIVWRPAEAIAVRSTFNQQSSQWDIVLTERLVQGRSDARGADKPRVRRIDHFDIRAHALIDEEFHLVAPAVRSSVEERGRED